VSSIEAVAVAFGALSVFLSARQIIWSWPTAIVNVLLYIAVFHEAKLYADMGLQAVYAVINAYGWYQWLYGGAQHSTLRVSRVPGRLAVRLAILAATSAATLGWAMASFTDASLPYLDAALSTTSLAAQWMLARKYLENWMVWIVLDLVYIPMFIYKGLTLTAGLYFVFLVLSIMGLVEWRRSLKANAKLSPLPAT
jgi:nicotinamide mononucleotide transporter